MALFFWRPNVVDCLRHCVERGAIAGSASKLWVSFLPGGIDPFRQKPDLCQSSSGKRSRQKFKAASITFNNKSQRHEIEQKVVDRMCERIGPLFELKQQGARLLDRGPTIACVYQGIDPVKDLQASSLSQATLNASNAVGE
ncbi:hypothetical protein NKH24_19895 [Mesorhizobium sp. M1300]|uniref:hypothetical protein n=1 Tax=Mesorhizobium sp. M1300 TaxID=2957077 RepID=UPI00333BB949